MVRRTRGTLLAALAMAAATLVGCAREGHVEAPEAEAASPTEQVAQARAALTSLARSRYADGAPTELARVDEWLGEVELAIADGDEDDEVTTLRLLAIRAQLGALKSFFARREAEAALENVRSNYERQQDSLETLEEENSRLLDSTGDLP
jgi:hypothetical protein